MNKAIGLKQQLLQGGLGGLMAQAVEVGLGLLLVVLLARLLGVSGYGVYAFVFAVASLVSMPARMGLPPLVVRETARGEADGDWDSVRGVWWWANAVTLGLSLLALAGGMAVLALGWIQDQSIRDTFLVGIWLVPLLALAAIRSASLRGLRHVVAGMLPEQVLRPGIMAILLLIVLLWSGASMSPAGAMGLMLVSALIAFLVGAALLHRYRPRAVVEARRKTQGGAWFRAAWPMAFTQGFQQLSRHADVILLGVLAAAVDVGVYRVGAQGALLVSFGLTALNMVVAPFFTRFYAEDEQQKLQKLARKTAQAALGFAFPAVVIFALYGEAVLVTLFGADFGSAYWPLLILSVGQLANAAFGPTGLLLNMTGHEREVTWVVSIAAVLNVVLNLTLIPILGVVGAALATSVSLVFWNLWLWFLIQRRLGIRCSAV